MLPCQITLFFSYVFILYPSPSHSSPMAGLFPLHHWVPATQSSWCEVSSGWLGFHYRKSLVSSRQPAVIYLCSPFLLVLAIFLSFNPQVYGSGQLSVNSPEFLIILRGSNGCPIHSFSNNLLANKTSSHYTFKSAICLLSIFIIIIITSPQYVNIGIGGEDR